MLAVSSRLQLCAIFQSTYLFEQFIDKPSPKMAPVRTATKMEKSQSENPATEFAQFADQEDREKTGADRPLTEKHDGIVTRV